MELRAGRTELAGKKGMNEYKTIMFLNFSRSPRVVGAGPSGSRRSRRDGGRIAASALLLARLSAPAFGDRNLVKQEP